MVQQYTIQRLGLAVTYIDRRYVVRQAGGTASEGDVGIAAPVVMCHIYLPAPPPGLYKLPLVYGNSLGNEKAYKTGVSGYDTSLAEARLLRVMSALPLQS